MAEQDGTSKLARRRRNQPQYTTAAPVLATADSGRQYSFEPPPPPRTLEEAIETARIFLFEARAMLHCISQVLLYADNADSVMHADVARAAARWIGESAVELDLVKLRPLIEAIRKRDDGTSGNEASQGEPGSYPPYQVREPTAVY